MTSKLFKYRSLVLILTVFNLNAASIAANPTTADREEEHFRTINKIDAVILGVVEGITEYLPISSTGHLILTSHAMGLSEYSQAEGDQSKTLHKAPALDAYEIVIQLGAIIAVLGIYRRRVKQMIRGVLGKDREGLHLTICLGIAFIPAAVVGLLFRSHIKAYLFRPIPVAVALALGGLLMLIAQHLYSRKSATSPRITNVASITYKGALLVGLFQCLALWPGTSRSMVTIVGALAAGLSMVAAAEFSFLLALPTLGAATLYEGFGQWRELTHGTGLVTLIIGTLVSLVVAFLAVEWLVKWLTDHGLSPFGYYRLALAAAVIGYFLFFS
ncbi:MAG: undecaprenyl-diphosphate phosphatase [Lentisphaeria bacterium]